MPNETPGMMAKETNRKEEEGEEEAKEEEVPAMGAGEALKGTDKKLCSKYANGDVSLGHDYKPSENDVICARGSRAFQHPGNQRFREIIKENMAAYSSAENNRMEKSNIVSRIVDFVSDSRGVVVKKDESGEWFQVGLTAAREKVGQG